MTPGQLVKAVAVALDVPEETVVQHDRNLVVAGLRTTGARGRNAPAVTALDAARLLAGVLASIRTKDSVATVRAFEQTAFEPPTTLEEMITEARERGVIDPDEIDISLQPVVEKFSDMAIMSLPKGHNFIEALASLITHASELADVDELKKRFSPMLIDCEMPGASANIAHLEVSGSARYRKPMDDAARASAVAAYIEMPVRERRARYYGIRQKRSVYGSSIMLLGKAFRDDGLNFDTTQQALDALLGVKKGKSKKKAAA